MYQFHHNLFPDDLLEPNYFTLNNEVHNYNTRCATNIRVGLVNTCLASNTIRIQGALLWNILPASLKNAPSKAFIYQLCITITCYFLLFTCSRLYLPFTSICITTFLRDVALIVLLFPFFLIKSYEDLSAPLACCILLTLLYTSLLFMTALHQFRFSFASVYLICIRMEVLAV